MRLNCLNLSRLPLMCFLTALSGVAPAHHSSNLYQLDQLVGLKGSITQAYFGAPHSRYHLHVQDESGATEEWLVIVQDPEDSQRFGYYEEVSSLSEGDRISFIGWPHRRNSKEILAHLLVLENGREVELVPPGGYARPALYLAMDQRVEDPDVLDRVVQTDEKLTAAERILNWSAHDDPISRAAAQVQLQRARLIGIAEAGGVSYPGAPNWLLCQADPEHAEVILASELMSGITSQSQGEQLVQFIQIYNRVLSKYWEIAWNSCGA